MNTSKTKKGKQHSSLLWKAFHINGNYSLLLRHFNILHSELRFSIIFIIWSLITSLNYVIFICSRSLPKLLLNILNYFSLLKKIENINLLCKCDLILSILCTSASLIVLIIIIDMNLYTLKGYWEYFPTLIWQPQNSKLTFNNIRWCFFGLEWFYIPCETEDVVV